MSSREILQAHDLLIHTILYQLLLNYSSKKYVKNRPYFVDYKKYLSFNT